MTFEYQKYVLPRRRRNQAAGLTVLGKPRVDRIKRTDLAGLDRRTYHLLYMRTWREKQKAL